MLGNTHVGLCCHIIKRSVKFHVRPTIFADYILIKCLKTFQNHGLLGEKYLLRFHVFNDIPLIYAIIRFNVTYIHNLTVTKIHIKPE